MPARDKKGEERLFLKSGSLGTPDDIVKVAVDRRVDPQTTSTMLWRNSLSI